MNFADITKAAPSSPPPAINNSEFYFALMICPFLICLIVKRIWSFLPIFNKRRFETPDGKAVIITGADTGFGALAAARLARQGYHVFAGCLSAKTAAVPEDCEDRYHILQMDVTKEDQIQAAVNALTSWLHENPDFRLHAIINNAGITYPMAPLELCSMASFKNVVDVNVYGALRVFKAFVPVMRSGGVPGGRVVVMGSLAAELTCPMMGAYCASKWALSAISDTLRYELRRFGIHVSSVMPDLYRTQLVTNKEALYASLNRELATMDESAMKAYGGEAVTDRMRWFIEIMERHANPNLAPVVDTIVEAVCCRQPKSRYYPISWRSKVVTTLARWFPSLLDNMVCIGQLV